MYHRGMARRAWPWIAAGIAAAAGLVVAGGAPATYDVNLAGKSPKGKRHGTRPWSQIKGITLHQVGVKNVGTAAWPRVTAHLGVAEDGTVYRIHPLRSYLWHGHNLNRDTIGIEVGGLFPGFESKRKPGASKLTSAQVRGLRRAIAYAVDQVRKGGGKVERVYAHRQAHWSRGLDPGEAIWRAGGLWAQDRYGLSDGGVGYVRGSGKPIPSAWDPRRGVAAVLEEEDEEVVVELDAEAPEEQA